MPPQFEARVQKQKEDHLLLSMHQTRRTIGTNGTNVLFRVGDIIRHKRYHYRYRSWQYTLDRHQAHLNST